MKYNKIIAIKQQIKDIEDHIELIKNIIKSKELKEK